MRADAAGGRRRRPSPRAPTWPASCWPRSRRAALHACSTCRTRCCRSPSTSARRARTAPISCSCTDASTATVPARRRCCATGPRSRACSTCPGRARIREHHARAAEATGRIVLAGKLGPDNVAAAVARVRPWAVDASSRLEAEPGVKDHAKVREFVAAARHAERPTAPTAGATSPRRSCRRSTSSRRAGARRRAIRASRPSSHALLTSYVGPADAAVPRRAPAPDASISSARTSTTRARTRSTTRSGRRCSRGGSASSASSPRPAPASTAWRPRPSARASALECVVYMGSEDMRRQAPNVERMRTARRGGRPGRVRHAHAEGGDERGDPRLDHERRDDLLPDRLVRRPGALPRARAGAAGRDRPRGARAGARRGRAAARRRGRVRRRRLERDRALRRLPRRSRGATRRRRGGGRGVARQRAARASSTARARRSSPTRTARSPTRTRSRPGSTTPASGPSTRTSATRGRAEYLTATDEEALDAFRLLTEREGIIPALEPSHALARALDLDAELVVVWLSGRGDKDLAEVLERSRRRRGVCHRHDRKTLVIYLMSGPETPALAEAAVDGRRRPGRARVPVLRPAGRRARHPPRRRARARAGHADARLPRVPRGDASAGRRPARADDVRVAARGVRLRPVRRRRARGRRDLAHRRRPPGRGAPGARARAARRANVDGRAHRARGRAHRRLALPRHA